MMTDNLRDSIAYALAQADGDLPGMEPDTWDYKLADAVIRELGLRPEWGHLNHEDSGRLYDTLEDAHKHSPLRGETLRTRLITDWTDVPAR